MTALEVRELTPIPIRPFASATAMWMCIPFFADIVPVMETISNLSSVNSAISFVFVCTEDANRILAFCKLPTAVTIHPA